MFDWYWKLKSRKLQELVGEPNFNVRIDLFVDDSSKDKLISKSLLKKEALDFAYQHVIGNYHYTSNKYLMDGFCDLDKISMFTIDFDDYYLELLKLKKALLKGKNSNLDYKLLRTRSYRFIKVELEVKHGLFYSESLNHNKGIAENFNKCQLNHNDFDCIKK